MEKATKKAIESGWRPWDSLNHVRMENPEEIEDCPSIECIDFIFERYERGGKDHALQLYSKILMDYLFWQSLAKSEGWDENDNNYQGGDFVGKRSLFEWHRLIDHLASDKDIDSFFDKLLTN